MAVAEDGPAPLKLEVSAARDARVNSQAPLKVHLLDTTGRPATSKSDVPVELTIVSPTGKEEIRNLFIKAGTSEQTVTWRPDHTGITVFKAREQNDRVIDGGDAALVKPEAAQEPLTPPAGQAGAKDSAGVTRGGKIRAKLPHRPPPSRSHQTRSATGLDTESRRVINHRGGACQVHRRSMPLSEAAPAILAQAPAPAAAAAPEASDVLFAKPHLLLQIQERSTGVFANNADFAKVHVFYVDPRNSNTVARSDIKVWFDWHGGWVDPQPAVIRKGTSEVEAAWKSPVPGDATLRISNSAPDLPWSANSEMRVSFVAPIRALRLDGDLELSFLDEGALTATLVDFDGKPVSAGITRAIRFSSNNVLLKVDPPTFELSSNQWSAAASLRPTKFFGQGSVQAEMAGFSPVSHKVKVTWIAALLSCIAGGLAGALVGNLFAKTLSWPRALVVGTVAGTVLSVGAELGLFLLFGVRVPRGAILVPIISFLGGGGGPVIVSYSGTIFTASKVGVPSN